MSALRNGIRHDSVNSCRSENERDQRKQGEQRSPVSWTRHRRIQPFVHRLHSRHGLVRIDRLHFPANRRSKVRSIAVCTNHKIRRWSVLSRHIHRWSWSTLECRVSDVTDYADDLEWLTTH